MIGIFLWNLGSLVWNMVFINDWLPHLRNRHSNHLRLVYHYYLAISHAIIEGLACLREAILLIFISKLVRWAVNYLVVAHKPLARLYHLVVSLGNWILWYEYLVYRVLSISLVASITCYVLQVLAERAPQL